MMTSARIRRRSRGDHAAERGGHQHVDVELEQLVVGQRLAAGRVDDAAGLLHVVEQRVDVEPPPAWIAPWTSETATIR
jgi:hypothetical protein